MYPQYREIRQQAVKIIYGWTTKNSTESNTELLANIKHDPKVRAHYKYPVANVLPLRKFKMALPLRLEDSSNLRTPRMVDAHAN